MIMIWIQQKERGGFRKGWTVVSEDQYLSIATVSADPTNPIQLPAAKENRSIQGFEDCDEVLYFFF